MQHPDEGMIHTWLDGELPAEEAAALGAHVATCDQCKAAVVEARGFIAASSRIVGALDNVPGGVIPIAKPAKRMWYSSPQFRAAAAVVVVAGASLLVMRTGTQKAGLTASARPEASEAATQRVMSANAPAVVLDSAAVKPPAVASQTAKKAEAPKPAVPATPPRELQVPAAPARVAEAPKISPTAPKVANEADFSGTGVKGSTAFGGAGGVPATKDTAALSGRVAGVAMSAADAVRPRAALGPAELRVLHVDSSSLMKRTIYQSLSGSQIVLTEQPAELALSQVMVTGAAESRKAAARSAPTASNAPVASAPAPAAQNEIAVHTITWTDVSTRRRYTLTGPVSSEELEAIKAQILKTKH
jgi:hypothetical protein